MGEKKRGVSFDVSNDDEVLIYEIVIRAVGEVGFRSYSTFQGALMDITAVHANGCRLDLRKFLDSSKLDFYHDFAGIRRHLDRDTGVLLQCFVPRSALREQALA